MAKKICYLCTKEYATRRVLNFPLCRKCKREVKRYSKKAVRHEYKTVEDKLLNSKKRFDSRRDFLLGWLLCTLLIIALGFAACLRYGGF